MIHLWLLVAELFEDQGYKAVLTPPRSDGGKDIYVYKSDPILDWTWKFGDDEEGVLFVLEGKEYGVRLMLYSLICPAVRNMV